MDLQLSLVALVTLAATSYLGRAVWRTWAGGGGGCAKGCGCGPKPAPPAAPLIAPDELLARVRSGGPRGTR